MGDTTVWWVDGGGIYVVNDAEYMGGPADVYRVRAETDLGNCELRGMQLTLGDWETGAILDSLALPETPPDLALCGENFVRLFFHEQECYDYLQVHITSLTLVSDTIAATIDIDPNTLNLKSRGKWVTGYIELPAGYDVEDIDVGSVLLEDAMGAQRSDVQGSTLMVKFRREDLIEYLDGATGEVTLTVTGDLTDGTSFEGSDTIRVKSKGKGGKGR